MFTPKPGCRIELHLLKSHAASNLNRDESGRPKTMIMGGCRRLRYSSQSEKYSIRHSEIFEQFLDYAHEKYGATRMVRTRKGAHSIKITLEKKIQNLNKDPKTYENEIDQALTSFPFFFSRHKTQDHNEQDLTQLVAFSISEIEYLANAMLEVTEHGDITIKDITEIIKQLKNKRTSVGPLSPELQLFGRFTTASSYFRDIDSPLQISHGFTVHESHIEQDYWSAVDDLNRISGIHESGHLNSRSFGSGVFYHYYCLDVSLLSQNITSAFPHLDRSQLVDMTRDLIAAFLFATLCRNPVGNQSNYANHDLPSCAYITYGNAFPYSAQNAFERPVPKAQHGGFLEEARQCFIAWLDDRHQRFGIFSGFEQCMGINEQDTDLKTLVESTIEKATEAIRCAIPET
ncbi:MAG: type I-E CRISPR-associated protein Cas7/Cse4/CasC [Desulfobulbus sp.]|nr:type I-E CRISPR-associated protein Cas7/Cse4/CasC [Desulfobulbus sp.]